MTCASESKTLGITRSAGSTSPARRPVVFCRRWLEPAPIAAGWIGRRRVGLRFGGVSLGRHGPLIHAAICGAIGPRCGRFGDDGRSRRDVGVLLAAADRENTQPHFAECGTHRIDFIGKAPSCSYSALEAPNISVCLAVGSSTSWRAASGAALNAQFTQLTQIHFSGGVGH